jgi:hypothetical protein
VTSTSSTSRPARRTLVKGAAWSVPAIAVATQAHAQSASPGEITFIQTGACKSPGASCSVFRFGYIFTFDAINTYPCDITVQTVDVTLLTGTAPGTLSVTGPIFVPQGTTPSFTIQVNGTNSANVTFTAQLTFNYTDCAGDPQQDTTIITISGTPPDCLCPDGSSASETTVEEQSVEAPEETSVEEPATQESTVEEPATETADTAESTAGTDR